MPEQLTPHFRKSEFACKCGCGFDDIDINLVIALEDLREEIGLPIRVTSACRCEKHNAKVKGEPNSQHLLGKAADIKVSGMDTWYIASLAKRIPAFKDGGIGIYDTFVHLDIRGSRARWDNRKGL